jgi:hypothetical protein
VSERLPAPAVEDAQRVLDQAARRLLAARLNRDPLGSSTGRDGDALEDGADQGALLVEGKGVPIVGANGDRRSDRSR